MAICSPAAFCGSACQHRDAKPTGLAEVTIVEQPRTFDPSHLGKEDPCSALLLDAKWDVLTERTESGSLVAALAAQSDEEDSGRSVSSSAELEQAEQLVWEQVEEEKRIAAELSPNWVHPEELRRLDMELGGVLLEEKRHLRKAQDREVWRRKQALKQFYADHGFLGANQPRLHGCAVWPGRTYPLHYAAKKGDERVVEFLLQEGACRQSLNARGETPAMLAQRKNRQGSHDGVLRLLLGKAS